MSTTQNTPYGPVDPNAPFPTPPVKKKHTLRNVMIGGIAGMALLIGGCSAAMSGGGTTDVGASIPSVAATTDAPEAAPAPAKPAAPKPVEAPKPKPKPTMTKSQRQAVGSAEDYLDSGQHFSKKSLAEQLKYEEFSAKDAKFAVNHVKVNWTEQADGAAQDYLDSGQHFSHGSLLSQLKFEGFTAKQAAHGVKAVEL